MSDMDTGCSVDAGLPNITGFLDNSLHQSGTKATSFTGAYTASLNSSKMYGDSGYGTAFDVTFNASNSNGTYGSSDTVTPKSVSTQWFIKF